MSQRRVPFVSDHFMNYLFINFGEVIETKSYKVRVLATKAVVDTETCNQVYCTFLATFHAWEPRISRTNQRSGFWRVIIAGVFIE